MAKTQQSPALHGRRVANHAVPGCWLVVQLQSELDLTWIVGGIARRTDASEVRCVVEVERVADGDDTIAAEARCVEVGVIQDIEELRTEL